jgi:phthalate 4,5-cis-dihydrodiol dehydrogenase
MDELRLGFAGLGMGAARIIAEISDLPYVRVTAGADLREPALAHFRREFGGSAYATIEELCASTEIDAVYIATPHQYHADHAVMALEAGKHVIVEKPMAMTLDEAERMNDAAERNNRRLLCGHTHSFDAPVVAMMDLVRSGHYGDLLAINTSYYKNFMYRPWSDKDVEISRGVVLNQGPHQVDIVRLLGGGLVKSVRGKAARWDPDRPGEGHYVCYLEFESGVPASLVFNGYALFDSAELVWDIGEGGEQPKDYENVNWAARRFMRGVAVGPDREQIIEKRLDNWRYGGDAAGEPLDDGHGRRNHQPFFGLTIVSLERAELRQSPDGVYIYTEEGREEVVVPQGLGGRQAEMREFFEAIRDDRPVSHDGRWGEATLEVCLGLLESSETGNEVQMKRQVAVPDH